MQVEQQLAGLLRFCPPCVSLYELHILHTLCPAERRLCDAQRVPRTCSRLCAVTRTGNASLQNCANAIGITALALKQTVECCSQAGGNYSSEPYHSTFVADDS